MLLFGLATSQHDAPGSSYGTLDGMLSKYYSLVLHCSPYVIVMVECHQDNVAVNQSASLPINLTKREISSVVSLFCTTAITQNTIAILEIPSSEQTPVFE